MTSPRRYVGTAWAAAALISLLVAGCGAATQAHVQPAGSVSGAGPSPTTPSKGWGSHAVASSLQPAVAPTELQFAGAVNGSSAPAHESCDYSSSLPFGRFTLDAEGDVGGRPFFLSISVTPYRGPGSYELGPLPVQPLTGASPPDPLAAQAPSGYPGFLNFIPKGTGLSYSIDRNGPPPTMTVAPDLRSGWFAMVMTAFDHGGTALALNVAGRFQCGPAFVA